MVSIKETTLEWSLKHCRDHSSNFIPISFEYNSIENDWDKIKRMILSQNLEKWRISSKRKFIIPKDKFGFRVVTELDPLDHLIYAGLIYEIGEDIERNRPSINDKNVFSYRYKPNSDGTIYDPNCNYLKFLEHCQEVAESGDYDYVAVTDITDFYLNIYEHRLENNLKHFTNKENHVNSIIHLLKQWNEKVSSGIPIGPVVSRLLAESLLIDIDNLLIMEGIEYCRWNDDFRIFANSYEEAYNYVYKLSNFLYKSHNLTLQSSKTNIINVEDFIDKYILSEARYSILKIEDRLDQMGIMFDPYNTMDEINLSDEELDEMELSTLSDMLVEEAISYTPNLKLMRYLISRLIAFNEYGYIEILLDNIDLLYPIISEIMTYIIKSDVDGNRKDIIKEQLLKVYNEPIIKTIDFARLWILRYFVLNPSIIETNILIRMYNNESEDVKREIINILGEKCVFEWVRMKKGEWQNFSPWVKRAYLNATHCLPEDEKINFHRSISGRLNPLDKSIINLHG